MVSRFGNGSSSKAVWVELGIIAFALGLLAALPSLPDFPLCAYRIVTGHPCPTCGTTHSVWAIMHGRFVDAWYYNPAGFVVVFVLLRRIMVLLAPKLVLSRVFDNNYLNPVLLGLFFAAGLFHYLV